jgi:hypothetical protein
MPDRETRRGIARMIQGSYGPRNDAAVPRRPRNDAALPPSKPMRTQEELAPLAEKVAGNAELVKRFRAVIGSDDKVRVSAMIDEVRQFAQTLDPTVSHPEGTRIALLLFEKLRP